MRLRLPLQLPSLHKVHHGVVKQLVSGPVPEKYIKMDNRTQLFGTSSALVLHHCTPSRLVTKTINSCIVGFPRICITVSSLHVHAMTFHQKWEDPQSCGCIGMTVVEWGWERKVFVNSPHNPAGLGQCSSCYITAWTKLPFPAALFFHNCTSCTSPQKERQDSSSQVCPVPLDTSTLCTAQEKNFR